MTRLEKLKWLKQWYRENRASLQSQPALVSAIKSNAKIESAITELYLALYNKTLGGCGSCLADAFVQLYAFPDDKMKEIMDCQFILRRGVVLQDVNGILPMVTSANITDALAIAYLRDNRARLDMFESYPENVEELISDVETVADEQTPTNTETTAQIEEKTAETTATVATPRRRRIKKS